MSDNDLLTIIFYCKIKFNILSISINKNKNNKNNVVHIHNISKL